MKFLEFPTQRCKTQETNTEFLKHEQKTWKCGSTKNNSKICDFLLRGQEVLGGPFQGVLARSYNYLKVDTMKERSSHHFLPTIKCVFFYTPNP